MEWQSDVHCWFHRFGGDSPCNEVGQWQWASPPEVPGRAVLLAMRWCDQHKHQTDTRTIHRVSTPPQEGE